MVIDPRKIVTVRTIGVDLRTTATDIDKITIDQPMTTTNMIMTGTITMNQDIHDTIEGLPITIAVLGPWEIIDDPRIIDDTTLPTPSLDESPNTPNLGKTRLVVNPILRRPERKTPTITKPLKSSMANQATQCQCRALNVTNLGITPHSARQMIVEMHLQ